MAQSSRRGQTKMASRIDSKQQGCCNKTIFSIRAEQTRDKINTNRKASSRAEGTRENKGITLPVQPKGRREVYMRPQRPNHGSIHTLLREVQHKARGPTTPNK